MGRNRARDLDQCHCLSSAPPRFSGAIQHAANARRIIWNDEGTARTAQTGRLLNTGVKYTINQVISSGLLATSASRARVAPRVAEGFYFRGFKTNMGAVCPPSLRDRATAFFSGLRAPMTLAAVLSCVHPFNLRTRFMY